VLALQVIAAGLLLLGSALVVRTVMVLDGPSLRPARARRVAKLVTAAPQRRHAVPDRRAA
jgi:hypothetical protein